MRIKRLAELGERDEQAVIINVGTKLVSTLALQSALRHARMPVLVIDCESDDGSYEHFCALEKHLDFDLLSAPLRRHSAALDWLFSEIPARKVLLVDSDVEILNDRIFALMREFIDEPRVFGAGFIEGPNWMSQHAGFARHGYFEERMWIPLTMLKVEVVRAAIDAGESFSERQVFNDFASVPFISRALGSLRYRVPALAGRQLGFLDLFKESHRGLKPWLVWYDTGARLYRHLKYVADYQFVGLPAEFHPRYARHFSGVTNNKLNPGHDLGASLDEIHIYVRARLRDVYGMEI